MTKVCTIRSYGRHRGGCAMNKVVESFVTEDGRTIGWTVHVDAEHFAVRFGGVKAIKPTYPSTSAKGEIRAIIGPNGAGKIVDAQCHQRVLSPARGGRSHFTR